LWGISLLLFHTAKGGAGFKKGRKGQKDYRRGRGKQQAKQDEPVQDSGTHDNSIDMQDSVEDKASSSKRVKQADEGVPSPKRVKQESDDTETNSAQVKQEPEDSTPGSKRAQQECDDTVPSTKRVKQESDEP